MTATHRGRDVFHRVFWGLLGATMVTAPPLLSWADVKLNGATSIALVEYSTVVLLGCSWLGAVVLSAVETEPHPWSVFFKAVGVPGTIVAAGQLLQIPT